MFLDVDVLPVPGVVGAWTASSDRRAPPLLQRRPRWDRLRAGHDDGDTQGASIGEGGELRRVPFLSTTWSPVPDEIPKGPVKASTRSVPVVRLDLRGSAVKTAISRYQLAAMLKCPLRDLRVADPTFPGQYPSILARNGSIIFAISDVKAVVCANELLLFPTTPEVLSVVSKVQEKLAQKALGDEAEVPFEQMAIECCLRFVFQALLDSLRDLEPRLRKVLDSFRSDKHSFGSLLHSLLPLKNEMDELCQTVTEVCKCMNDVLLNDEDMALMYLTEAARNRGKARDPQDHQDIEMLFENYLLQVELIASELRDFQDEVRNTEEIVEIELDVMRNKLMRFELVLSITAFTVSLGALVTGVFGMNLLSGWETQPRTFWIVTGGIYSCMLVLVAGTLAFCRLLKLL